jgi:hypothetical protein
MLMQRVEAVVADDEESCRGQRGAVVLENLQQQQPQINQQPAMQCVLLSCIANQHTKSSIMKNVLDQWTRLEATASQNEATMVLRGAAVSSSSAVHLPGHGCVPGASHLTL